MNNIFKNLKEQLHTLSMTDTERAEIRLRLASHMHSFQPKRVNFILSPYLFGVWQKRLAVVTAVFLIVMITSGSGLAYASNGALPGEALYTVKVKTENMQAAVKPTPEARANFEVKRVERRINEAVTLAAQGKLDDKKKETIATSLKRHTDRVTVETKKIIQENPDTAVEVSAKLALSLEAHNEAISDAQDQRQVDGELDSIIEQVNEAKVEAKAEQAEATEALVASGDMAVSQAEIDEKKARVEAAYAAAFPEAVVVEPVMEINAELAIEAMLAKQSPTAVTITIASTPKEQIDGLRIEIDALLVEGNHTEAFLKLQEVEDLLMKITIKSAVAQNIENVQGPIATSEPVTEEIPAIEQPAVIEESSVVEESTTTETTPGGEPTTTETPATGTPTQPAPTVKR